MRQTYPLFKLIPLCFILACGGDSEADNSTANSSRAYYSSINVSCQTDADCAVENVGNCCGYYPACVRKGQIIDPSTLAQACVNEEISGVCGFPDISNCICDKGKCRAPDGVVGNGLF